VNKKEIDQENVQIRLKKEEDAVEFAIMDSMHLGAPRSEYDLSRVRLAAARTGIDTSPGAEAQAGMSQVDGKGLRR
jgi:hypothetical protein